MTNRNVPAIEVRHAELTRFGDSAYKSECLCCPNGVLLMERHPETFQLSEQDRCMVCGQRVIYLDIREVRMMEGDKR